MTKSGEAEIDRKFMALIIDDPQYRLRWLDWGQDLTDPITEFLDHRVDLGTEPFVRTLPAQLVIEVCRQAYIHWVQDADITTLESVIRAGMQMIVRAMPPAPCAT